MYHIALQLNATNNAFGAAIDSKLRPLEINSAQMHVLLILHRYPETTVARLSRLLDVTPQTVHRTITSLERRELVIRGNKPGNKKDLPVTLTNYGVDVLARGELIIKEIMDRAQRNFSPAEMEQLNALLERCRQAL